MKVVPNWPPSRSTRTESLGCFLRASAVTILRSALVNKPAASVLRSCSDEKAFGGNFSPAKASVISPMELKSSRARVA